MKNILDLDEQKKVLIADDDEALRFLLSNIVQHDDIEVYTASDGLEALDIIKSVDIDVLITDIMMPKLDGFQLATSVREMDRGVQTIFITAHEESSMLLSAMRAGAYEFITKPFEHELVVETVHKAMILAKYKKLQKALLDMIFHSVGYPPHQSNNLAIGDKYRQLKEMLLILMNKLKITG